MSVRRITGNLEATSPSRLSAAPASRLHGLVRALIDRIRGQALIVDERGNLVEANAPARRALEEAAPEALDTLSRALRAEASSATIEITRLDEWGAPGWKLAVIALPENGGLDARLELAVSRWRLTPRQGEVLRGIVRGLRNREIADQLGCAERTVELHVTVVLSKAAQPTRTALVSAFWALDLSATS